MRPLLAVVLLVSPLSAQQPTATIEVPEKLVLGLAFSPDGKSLASSGSWMPKRDFEIHLWDINTKKELKVLKIPKETRSPIHSIQFSPDGNKLFAGSLNLWDLNADKTIAPKGEETPACSVLFCDGGKTLAAGAFNNTLQIWDVQTGKEQARIGDATNSAHFTPDGKTLVYGMGIREGFIKLWDVATSKEKLAIKVKANQVNLLACSNDTIAYYSTIPKGSEWVTTVHLLDFTGKELHRLTGHDSYLACMAFSSDGKFLATGSADKTVRLWDVGTGKQLTSLPAGDCWALALSPDGKTLATGTRENAIKLWDVVGLTKKQPGRQP